MIRRLLAIALLLSVAVPAAAQSPASAGMTGVVLDPDAKMVAEAAIVVLNENTGAIRTTTTDRTAAFRCATCPSGITPSRSSFRDSTSCDETVSL